MASVSNPTAQDDGYLRLVPCRHGRMLVNPGDIYIGRALIVYGEFSPAEAALYGVLVGPGDIVVEAGANIGAFSLVFARSVGAEGRVYAFEPQRIVFQMLCANLALNEIDVVEAWPVALGAEIGQMTVPPVQHRGVANIGGVALTSGGEGESVPVTTIDNLSLKRCTLIKADVEGMECAVLEGAQETIRRCQPYLYFEVQDRASAPALIRVVETLGYRGFWHLPPLSAKDNFRGETENIFPGICSVNMLCTAPGRELAFPGLTEVRGPDDWRGPA